MSDVLRMELADGIARLTFNRPEAGNAIDVPLARALMEASIACDEDGSIRSVVLTGSGRMFCAGGDIAGFAHAGDRFSALLKELTAYLHMAVSRFARMGKPLVSVVNGPAAGAGMSLALLGDVVIAANSAKFNPAYAGVGLSPDGGLTWLLPRLIGLRRAQELLLTGRALGAEEAAGLGLITRAVADDALKSEADAVISKVAAGPSRSLGRTRGLLLSSSQTSLEEQLELEARAIAASGADPEGREGVAAFLAKRKPTFNT